jgi:hypothetical protein
VFIWLSNFKPFDALTASLFDSTMKYAAQEIALMMGTAFFQVKIRFLSQIH